MSVTIDASSTNSILKKDPSKWLMYQELYKNSVFQFMVNYADYDIARPYLPPKDRNARGSGFLIDEENGLILTNAHVGENSMVMKARLPKTGQQDLYVEVISICSNKDVALIKLTSESLKIVKETEPKSVSMPIGNSNKVKQTEEVLVIGYPLGEENIQYTTGVVSGYHSSDNYDDYDSPSYIQMTAPISPGNSGGPLINSIGQVIGINSAGIPSFFAQNINYVISSNTFMSILRRLMNDVVTDKSIVHCKQNIPLIKNETSSTNNASVDKNKMQKSIIEKIKPKTLVVRKAIFGFEFSTVNDDLLRYLKLPTTINGIYIKHVRKDSSLRSRECPVSDNDINTNNPKGYLETSLNKKDNQENSNLSTLGDKLNKIDKRLYNLEETCSQSYKHASSLINTESQLTKKKVSSIFDRVNDLQTQSQLRSQSHIQSHIQTQILKEIEKDEDGDKDTNKNSKECKNPYGLKEKDIISSIEWMSPYEDHEAFNVKNYFSHSDKKFKSVLHVANFDRYGQINLQRSTDDSTTMHAHPDVDHHLSLQEIMDLIPLDTEIKMSLWRYNEDQKKAENLKITTKYEYIQTDVVKSILLRWEPSDYVIVGGLCISQLYKNHSEMYSNIDDYLNGRKSEKPWLIITQVFSNSTINSLHVFEKADILTHVNDKKVHSIIDLCNALDNKDIYVFKNQKDSLAVISKEQAYLDDLKVIDTFNIDPSKTIWQM
jgi:S1-C subfamily serine protease